MKALRTRAACAWLALVTAPLSPAQWLEPDCLPTLSVTNTAIQDSFGWITDGVGDVTGDGIGDLVVAAPLSGVGASAAGLVRVLDGVTGAVVWTRVEAITSSILGYALVVSDWDRDGALDVVASAPFGSGTGGHVFVFDGATGATLHVYDPSNTLGDQFGASVAVGGDFDGDGTLDVAVGDTGYDPPGRPNAGRVYVYSGADHSLLATIDGPAVTGFDPELGTGLAFLGDVDGDGRAELVVGHREASFTRGRALVYGFDGSAPVHRYSVLDVGMPPGLLGSFIHGGLDVDGDGLGDFLVGDGTGNAADVFSGRDGSRIHRLDGNGEGGNFGTGTIVPDVDGDGRAELLIGARRNGSGANRAGKVFLYSGRTGAVLRTFTHTIANAQVGLSCRCIGDADGDLAFDYALSGTGGGTSGPPPGRLYVVEGAQAFPTFCVATPSSLGVPARISAIGPASVAANGLTLHASPVPSATTGIFFCGLGTAQVPLANGVRCVGGPSLTRLPVESATGHVLRHELDLVAGPAAGVVVAGATWHFQGWFRDPLGAPLPIGVTDAVTVAFTP